MKAEVEKVMQRHVDVAQHVLGTAEVTTMVLDVATDVSAAAILVAIQSRRPEVSADELFDIVSAALSEMLKRRKAGLPRILAQMERFQRGGGHG